MASLRAIIGDLDSDSKQDKNKKQESKPVPSGNQLNQNEIKQLRDMLGRFPQLDELVNKLLNDLKHLNIN